MCGGHRRTWGRLTNFSLSSLWKKSDKEVQSWPQWNSNRVLLDPKSQSFQLSHEALDEFSGLKRLLIRLWYVSFFVLCCRCAFFATSMFERASLLFFSMLKGHCHGHRYFFTWPFGSMLRRRIECPFESCMHAPCLKISTMLWPGCILMFCLQKTPFFLRR